MDFVLLEATWGGGVPTFKTPQDDDIMMLVYVE